MKTATGEDRPPLRGNPGEVLLAFLRLGLTSFGGPVAHLGYFRAEFVERRRWLSEPAYAELVGLCQFLPGPASSQTGFALGLLRAGAWGAMAAWAGFTLPSAVLMILFATCSDHLIGHPIGSGTLHGLKLVAVAVVAQAVWGMARSLCPDKPRAGIALTSAAIVTVLPVSMGQIGAIGFGALMGLALCRGGAPLQEADRMAFRVSRRAGIVCLGLFAALLALPGVFAGRWPAAAVFEAFYRSGALVFGGGHVVLPLLRDAVVGPGWVPPETFLGGYGAAQAVPGPLFAFAAFLGAMLRPGPDGIVGAILSLAAIFAPGLLLLVGVLPFWAVLRAKPGALAAMRGVNAAVVGVLAAALYDPDWTTAVLARSDFLLALIGFVLLTLWRAPPLIIVVLGVVVGAGEAALF